MVKVIQEKDIKKHELYNELKENFDHWHMALDFRPNAAPGWWEGEEPTDGEDDEVFFDVQGEFAFELACIIARYFRADDNNSDSVYDRARTLACDELNNIMDYADRIQDRMYDLELANYARDKFLNDLFDAVINEFGEDLVSIESDEVYESREAIDNPDSPEARFISKLLKLAEEAPFVRWVDTHTDFEGRTYMFEIDRDYVGTWERLKNMAHEEAYNDVRA